MRFKWDERGEGGMMDKTGAEEGGFSNAGPGVKEPPLGLLGGLGVMQADKLSSASLSSQGRMGDVWKGWE